jgi:hypothetical protein
MFRFTQKPSSGSYNQNLANITSLVQLCVSVQTLLVLQRHILTWCVCVCVCVCVWFTVQRRAGLEGCGKSPPIESPSPHRLARSESLYRLS